MEILLEQRERDAVAINPGMVRDEFIEFPSQLSAFGSRYADAISDAAAKAEGLEDIEAEVYLELRSGKGGDKSLTEATIKAMVRKDPRVRMARELYLQAEATKARFKHKVMDPLYAKRDMLISLGAHQRAELVGDPLLRYSSPPRSFEPRVTIEELEQRAKEGG